MYRENKFEWVVGTLQLFIVKPSPFLHVAASRAYYLREERVGTDSERQAAQLACDMLNKKADDGKTDFTKRDVELALYEAEKEIRKS